LRRIAGAGEPDAEGTAFAEKEFSTHVGERSFSRLVWEKIPWFALSAASALITMKAQAAAKHEELPLWEHLANAALSYAKYIGKTFWPATLAPLYPHPGRTISIPAATLSALGLIAITLLVVIFRKRRYLFVGWFWFLGTMVPMIGFVQVGVQSMADRYAYIPLLGIFVIVCWGAADLLTQACPGRSSSQQDGEPAPTRVLILASAVVLVALGFALHRQVNFWTNNFTLWRHTLDITKNNFIAEDSAATALLAQGKTDEAMRYFRRAQLVRPTDPVSALNVASYAQQQGNYASAIEQYGRVLELTNSSGLLALVYANRGYAHYALGQDDSAQQDFEAALKQQPKSVAAYQGLGLVAQRAGDWDEAARDFERAIEIQPAPAAYQGLAQVLESAGKKEAAEAARAQAAKMSSGSNRGARRVP
jgi:tetratricopeptide (TPR) repeat protein